MAIDLKYKFDTTNSPLWSFAIHDGHDIDEELLPYLLLNNLERLREEDPFTATIADLSINKLTVFTSRFQIDTNRNSNNAIYLNPDQAWGLTVYKKTLPKEYIQELLNKYQSFYAIIEKHIATTIKKFGYFIVFDIHSYNAKRNGPETKINLEKDPQINLGTYYNHPKWTPLLKYFENRMLENNLYGTQVDVRSNIKFKGGNLAQHLINLFGEHGCVISIEFRKDFMDEWTGIPDVDKIAETKQLLIHTIEKFKTKIDTWIK